MTESENTFHDLLSFASGDSKFKSKILISSPDIENVFTNVFLEGTTSNIINNLFLKTDKIHNFQREELKQLFTLAQYESRFFFDGEYNTQIDNVAMGSPLSATLANDC